MRQGAEKNAKQRVREKYLWKQIAEQISLTYEQMMQPGKDPLSFPPVKANTPGNSRAA
jgi:hypothetical protein